MKLLGLESGQQPAHRYKKTEQPHVNIPSRLDRQFDVGAPDQVWVGDITYVWTGKRWAYLAWRWICLHAIRWLVRSLSLDGSLTKRALTMAYESRGHPKGATLPY